MDDTSEPSAPDEGDGVAPPAYSRSARAAPVRVVVVDDHSLVREGTVQLLSQEPELEVVGESGSGEHALELLESLLPDVALVDVSLPGMSGLDLARELASRGMPVRVLVVSAYDDYAYVTEALEIGVGGYLLKTCTTRELVDAVRAVADGVFVLDRGVSSLLARRWRTTAASKSEPGALTSRETAVLALLARGRSNKQIASELALGLRTVEGHVSSLLSKLAVASRTEAVAVAIRERIVEVGPRGEPPEPG